MAYTKEDYLNTDKPYAELYAIKNPFEQMQRLQQMAADAEQADVKNFKTLYKMYCTSLKPVFVPENNTTDIAGQPQELDCGDWAVDEYGVRRGVGSCEVIAC